MAERIQPAMFRGLFNREVRLPDNRLTYSRDPADAASCRFYSLSSAATNEVEWIVHAMRNGSTYKEALLKHATQDNFFENYTGRRNPDAPSAYHIIVPLRFLRDCAERNETSPETSSREGFFSQKHTLELMRVTYSLYIQERDNALDDDAVLLTQERIFGDQVNGDSSRDVLYDMYTICHSLADSSTVQSFNNNEKADNNAARLDRLSAEHHAHRTKTPYEDGGYYYRDATGEKILFHALPLPSRGGPRQRNPGRRASPQPNGFQRVTLPELTLRMPLKTRYKRGATDVRVEVHDGRLWRALGGGQLEPGRADEVVADANDGSQPAARFLLACTLGGDVVFNNSQASAWCRVTEEGADRLEEYLTMGSLIRAVGMPYITSENEIILPIKASGRIAYLKHQGYGSVSCDWRLADDFSFVAKKYTGFSKDAKVVYS